MWVFTYTPALIWGNCEGRYDNHHLWSISIHSLSNYLLSSYYVSGSMLGVENTAVKQKKSYTLYKFHFSEEKLDCI